MSTGVLPEPFTPDQVADALGLSKKTVMRAIEAGLLRASQLAQRGCWRIQPEDVQAWLDARANRPRERPTSGRSTPSPVIARPLTKTPTARSRRSRKGETPGTLSLPNQRREP